MFMNWGKNWQAKVLWLSLECGCFLSIQLHWNTAILFVSELSMAALQWTAQLTVYDEDRMAYKGLNVYYLAICL